MYVCIYVLGQLPPGREHEFWIDYVNVCPGMSVLPLKCVECTLLLIQFVLVLREATKNNVFLVARPLRSNHPPSSLVARPQIFFVASLINAADPAWWR